MLIRICYWGGMAMSSLLRTIAKDLSIVSYYGESDSDFCYRVCYSALALSMLYSARSVEAGEIGISKKAQTERLQRILKEYENYMNLEINRFISDSNNFVTHSRKVYEETGYLMTDERGFDVLASYGRSVPIGSVYLFFGIPSDIIYSLGLGMYSDASLNEASLFDVFRRDTLSSDEYIARMFNPLDFEYRDIDKNALEFFNPSLRKPPSSSWGAEIRARRTVARNKAINTMYLVICEDDGKLLYADTPVTTDKDSLASYEIRRLFFALKEQHGEPAVAWFNRIDDVYYEVKLSAHLPTREYYFLLLCAWPKKDAFDRITFITTTDILPTIEKVFQNIGIRTIWRSKNV